jgi:PAS domain S-box-containing protein
VLGTAGDGEIAALQRQLGASEARCQRAHDELASYQMRYAALNAELQESEARFRNLLHHIPSVAVQGYGVDGITTYWNPASERLYGYTAQEALGRNLLDLIIPEEMHEAVREALQYMASTGQVIDASELVLRHKDGSPVVVFSSHALVQVPDRAVELFCLDIDIAERKRADAALLGSLREKESLLKEVHHRVKNNLQIISSLLRLQFGQIDNPVAQAALQDTQNRVRSMAMIHEHLYQSNNLAAVDLAAYLRSLCQYLVQALMVKPGAVRLHLDLAPVHLDIDQAIPCGLLVNELVSNALKHAFPEGCGGEVRVELHALADGPGWCLRVADNGVGLPPDFDLNQLTSLGLKLVTDLTRQLGGQLEIGAGPGTVVEMECPDHNP